MTKVQDVIKGNKFVVMCVCLPLLLFQTSCVRTQDLPVSADAVRPLAVGSDVPDVTLNAVDGSDFALRREARNQPLIVIFYRGGWCPYCTLHLAALGEVEGELREMGFRIVAVSPDHPEKLAESVTQQDLTYTLLSDSSMTAARGFGIAFQVDAATVAQYQDYGIDLEDASGETHHLLPVPAVFIVGVDGRVKFVYANPDYKVRLPVDDLLEAAKREMAR